MQGPGKVGITFRYWFIVRNPANGLPATGISSNDFTVVVRNPADDTSNSPSVSESGGGNGQYYFDIPGSFSATHGEGNYGVSISVDSAAPVVVDTGGDVVKFLPVAYEVKQSYSYNETQNELNGLVWVELDGDIATPTSVSVSFYNDDGNLQFTITDNAPDAQGVLHVTKATPGITAGSSYYAVATVTIGSVSVISGKGMFTVG
jgi:hypothetical protein